ncbi:diacylglycerol/lipid kinase family protein [Corynebacterium uterequi]|nr:diacylglycerol kinase family protein [Corynebacterium uterequi]
MDTSSSSRCQAVIVYNPVKVEQEELQAMIAPVAEEHGWEVSWVETEEDSPGAQQASEAAEGGAEMVIACGGDGTVRSVAEGLKGTDAALGIFPQGTGNLLARNLGLPLDLDEAVKVAFTGTERVIDFGRADITRPDGNEESLMFTVMAGVGIDAQMIVNTDDDLKKKAGVFAYAVAVAKSLGGGQRLKVEHALDDKAPKKSRAHSVIAGNCGELVGAVELIPDAEPDDGLLDIVVLRPKGVIGWLPIVGRIVGQMILKTYRQMRGISNREGGKVRDMRSMRYLTGKKFWAKLNRPEEFEVDGDTVGEVTEFTISLENASLKVRVPAE